MWSIADLRKLTHYLRNELRNQQRRITIAQETEVVSQGVVVHFPPVAMEEGTDEEEKSALRLMEIGDKHLHNLVLIAGGNDDLRAGVQRLQTVAVEIVDDGLYRLRRLNGIHQSAI